MPYDPNNPPGSGGFGLNQQGDPHAYWKQYGYGGSINSSTQIAEGNFQGNQSFGQALADRDNQAAFQQQMQDAATGKASATEAFARAAEARNQQNAASIGASARGGNYALAQREASTAAAQGNAQIAGQAAGQAAQEKAQARSAYADYLGGMRGQDLTSAQLQYGRAEQWGGVGNQAQANANQSRGLDQQQNQQDWNKVKDYAMAAGGAALLLSDETKKEAIKPASSGEMRGFLDALEADHYKYRGSDEPHVGVMAQDVASTPVGKTIVKDTPQGKALDTQGGFGLALAAMGDMHRRVSDIEEALRVRSSKKGG